MTLRILRPASFLTCSAAIVAAMAVTGHARQQTPAEQQTPQRPLARPIPAPPDVAAPPANTERTASGLATLVIQKGTGTTKPGLADVVTVEYTGWTTDGRMFDSSYARPKPSTFQLARVIPGWSEAVQQMVVGEKRRAWIPEALAYKGAEGKPKGMLVFDIELVNITPALETPSDVAAPSADATKTKSGLAYKVLKAGTGTEHPKKNSTVTVHYSGWTTDGRMFDSSVMRGQPIQFPLDRVIAGWSEGVQLMVVGEKARLWIPEKLAYQGQEGRPKGMLVFDVELISIDK
jgi:peptidylprolyl isomerase